MTVFYSQLPKVFDFFQRTYCEIHLRTEERLENGRGREERGERGLVNYYQKMRIKNNEASKRARLKRRIKQVGSPRVSALWIQDNLFRIRIRLTFHMTKNVDGDVAGSKII
jgi:hypothetical protein